jgi:hypothetical protein
MARSLRAQPQKAKVQKNEAKAVQNRNNAGRHVTLGGLDFVVIDLK